MDAKTLLGQNLRIFRLVNGQHAMGLKIAGGGFTAVLMVEARPVTEKVALDDQLNEDGQPLEVDVVKNYNISLLPLYFIPGTVKDKPEEEVKPEHVMFEATPIDTLVEAYFQTNEAYSAARNPQPTIGAQNE